MNFRMPILACGRGNVMTKPAWSPDQYLKFEDERTRPAKDLLAAVPNRDVAEAVDLGCGPGNSTELLVRRFPGAVIRGIDTSADMIERARGRLPDCSFDVADIDVWHPNNKVDLLYANAVMQWLPRHEVLFPRLMNFLDAGGSLAIQMPDHGDAPVHVALREIAAEGAWSDKLAKAEQSRGKVESTLFYYELLRPISQRVDIWRTTYNHPLEGIDGIVEWFKGAAMRPYLSELDEAERLTFLDRYKDRIAHAYRVMADGTVLLPFPRLFIVATR